MPDPPFYHKVQGAPPFSFFHVHIQPIFYLLSGFKRVFADGIPAAAYYTLVQGMISGFLGLAVYLACLSGMGVAFALLSAVATALCGPMLASVGFPHIELAIPALFLLSLTLILRGATIFGYVVLALCLLVREDAGLHAGAALILLALAQRIEKVSKLAILQVAGAGVACLAYSTLALAVQYVWFPVAESRLFQVYLGSPIGAHISMALIAERLELFVVDKAYATLPLTLVLGWAAWKRSYILAVGPLSVLPWTLMSLLAAQAAAAFSSFYAFPLVIGIAWPSIALGLTCVPRYLQLLTSSASIILFVALASGNNDDAPWRGIAWPDLNASGAYETALESAVARRFEYGRLMVDNAVASLIPNSLRTNEWAYQWAHDSLPNPDVIIYWENGWDWPVTKKVVDAASLTHTCKIRGTPFVVASRHSDLNCEPNRAEP